MDNITNKLNTLISALQNNSYFSVRNIANEIPYYIFDYNPEYELKVRETLSVIENNPKINYSLKIINIYDILLEHLKNKNFLTKSFDMEKKFPKEKFLIRMKSVITPELIVNQLKKTDEESNPDVFILHGIGSAYPILRVHLILNRLQEVIDRKPVIIMYPGKFEIEETEGQLILFNHLKSKAYYRAMKI